ncbi:hypothetical protein [Fimbriiglobus ruber]|uniref:DUF2029 domain-containing protein n=1 Tax=Fimbriiglobus ruber TaxID=1908690 RepID=A0A225D4P3_9BACT|nr:hypothetical protein [Fimbriiglobus ruber]OWK35913.1 hypothetical protein FRUB_08476 [Fimbriiglobus ruber]
MTPRHWLGRPAFLALVIAIQVGIVVTHLAAAPRDRLVGRAVFEPDGYLYGDSAYYAAAADSLWRDRDLDLLNQNFPGRATIAEVLPELEGPLAGEFGLSADGRLTLKQSPVLPAAALPFYAVMGLPGLLVFNLVVMTLLLDGVAQLAGGTLLARLVVLVGFLTTPLHDFVFNFSPDLFLCALLIGSLVAARDRRPLLAGTLAGLAVSSKLYVAVLVLPVPVVVWGAAERARIAAMVRFAAGGLVGLVPGVLFNWWLFGAPWVTGYERQLFVVNGQVGLAGHASRFTEPPLQGLLNILFDPGVGLWPTAPLWFLWPVAAGVLLAPRVVPPGGRSWVVAACLVILLNLALFASYDGWYGGSPRGNRYVFPAVVAAVALIGAAVATGARAWCDGRARSPDSASRAG